MKVSVKGKLNYIPELNDFLDDWNHELEIGDQMDCVAVTSHQEFDAIKRKYPPGIGQLIIYLVYFWHEMMPKMKATKRLYFFLGNIYII